MSARTDESNRSRASAIRERYEEYELGDRRLSVISDPENDLAWICSDRSCEVRP